jgi:hypothetical protein
MPVDRQLDDRISRWLEAEAPMQLPDRVLRATFERTRKTRQEAGWRAVLGRFQMNRLLFALGGVAAVAVVAVVAVGLYFNQPGGIGGVPPTPTPAPSPTAAPSPDPTASPAPTATPRPSIQPLPQEGSITPGTYTFEVDTTCHDGHPLCPADGGPPAPLTLEVTVPAAYARLDDFPVIAVDKDGTIGPGGGALVLGWTTYWGGLYSDPCLDREAWSGQGPVADIAVGPTVDEFVDAVVAHPALDVTDPEPVELGGYRGKFFSLTGPSDISGCEAWQPWDPSFDMQGTDNIWDVWVIDANGTRVMIVNEYFPETPAQVKSELRDMAESIRFVP